MNNSCLCFSTRSRQRYSRSFSATAKSVCSNSSMALSTNHCRCTRNSLPGSNSRFTTSSRSTFSQLTASRACGKRCCQNSSSPSCCHSSHASQQLPNTRGRRNSKPLSFTCNTVQRVGGNLPVVGKQTHAGVALFVFIEHIQCLAPRSLLLVVDLAQIQNRPLHRLVAGQSPILHDAEVAVILAVLLAVGAAQKHGKQQHGRNPRV